MYSTVTWRAIKNRNYLETYDDNGCLTLNAVKFYFNFLRKAFYSQRRSQILTYLKHKRDLMKYSNSKILKVKKIQSKIESHTYRGLQRMYQNTCYPNENLTLFIPAAILYRPSFQKSNERKKCVIFQRKEKRQGISPKMTSSSYCSRLVLSTITLTLRYRLSFSI